MPVISLNTLYCYNGLSINLKILTIPILLSSIASILSVIQLLFWVDAISDGKKKYLHNWVS